MPDAKPLHVEQVMGIITRLGPIHTETAQRVVELSASTGVAIDDMEMVSPHEMFGLLLHRARQFIEGVSQSEEAAVEGLEALKELQMEVTLFLYHVRKEILDGQIEEAPQEAGVEADTES